jgi:predicted glycoside hydrolase/deacetylase ChbG (UPF0249 family)
VDGQRFLIVMADDFGIGPATSRAMIELAGQGVITGAVLLVNSPYAEEGVRAWRHSGVPLELGWHPCLTLDRPVSKAGQVPTLVDADGFFYPLGAFLRRLFLGRVRAEEIRFELAAQERRFRDLVGYWPSYLNGHHHVHAFAPVGAILADLLRARRPLPYVRRVREPWSMLLRVPGARKKRAFLSLVGRRNARPFGHAGFPGNDWLAGNTDPACVADPAYLTRWLTRVPGQVVELACHPGYFDRTLVGRDCTGDDGLLQRRVDELQRLLEPGFAAACRQAGFELVTAGELARRRLEQAGGWAA